MDEMDDVHLGPLFARLFPMKKVTGGGDPFGYGEVNIAYKTPSMKMRTLDDDRGWWMRTMLTHLCSGKAVGSDDREFCFWFESDVAFMRGWIIIGCRIDEV